MSDSYKVLLIDDSQTIRKKIWGLLSPFYDVFCLEMFVNLPRMIRQNEPDVIILDINIPALNGIRLGQIVRKYQKHTIPIIVYSACPEPRREEALNKVGGVAQLSKDCSDDELLHTVQRILRDRPHTF